MDVTLAEVVEASTAVAATRSRTAKTQALASLFARCDPDEVGERGAGRRVDAGGGREGGVRRAGEAGDLLLEQRHVQRALHQSVAQVAGECGDHLAGALPVLVDQRADGIERVEEEVRVELVGEHPELRVTRGGHGAQCLLPLLAQRGDEVGTAIVRAGSQELSVPLVLDAAIDDPGTWWRLSNPGALG